MVKPSIVSSARLGYLAEEQVKAIHLASVGKSDRKLSDFTSVEVRAADEWIRRYALIELGKRVQDADIPQSVRDFLHVCATVHFGSVETDKMLTDLGCYPEWMQL